MWYEHLTDMVWGKMKCCTVLCKRNTPPHINYQRNDKFRNGLVRIRVRISFQFLLLFVKGDYTGTVLKTGTHVSQPVWNDTASSFLAQL